MLGGSPPQLSKFTAAQAAQKRLVAMGAGLRPFTAAQAAQKVAKNRQGRCG